MPCSFQPLDLPGAFLVKPRVFSDPRGFFLEVFKRSDFAQAGVSADFMQENHSSSLRGVLRGLHYQRAPRTQAKLVRVIEGEIFDVAVDLRKESATCGQWVSARLSAENKHMLYVPPWCAHGFCVLSERAQVVYLATGEYSAPDEGGVAWNDPAIGIEWPLTDPVLSERDQKLGAFEPLPEALFRQD